MKVSWPRKLGIAILHFVVAALAVPISTALLYYTFKPILLAFTSSNFVRADAILSAKLFPFQALVAFVGAWYLARKSGNIGTEPVARLIWIGPCVWWLFLIATWHHPSVLGETRWQHFLWSRSADAFKIQVVSTMPLITTVAYAFGSYYGASKVGEDLSEDVGKGSKAGHILPGSRQY